MIYTPTTTTILHSDRIVIKNMATGETQLIRNQDVLNRWYCLHINCVTGSDDDTTEGAYQQLEEAIRFHYGQDWCFKEAIEPGVVVDELEAVA